MQIRVDKKRVCVREVDRSGKKLDQKCGVAGARVRGAGGSQPADSLSRMHRRGPPEFATLSSFA